MEYITPPMVWLLAILTLNLITFAVFGWDKYCARTGGWRVPETTLLSLALFGGSVGAKLAQRRFRHKTRKQPFATYLNVIIALQVVAIPALIYPATRGVLLALFRDVL